MSNSDLLPSLLCKINENQLALEAAIMELSNWWRRVVQQTWQTMCVAPWTQLIGMRSSSS